MFRVYSMIVTIINIILALGVNDMQKIFEIQDSIMLKKSRGGV